ncbi:NAD(P)-dependent oxidoreductase [Tritonibacter horizontis]|uniref:2-hydroxy-3-oxopropionate reductase n=1 Tax=Tritonibacter horizontis TaxID=1768241 RepID=A0A132C2M9_9RHOB|nr:NAD(P)-dependent oxidoreductase [Tritonibacter horizontis]KUP94512.1 2-hydroxy-3-oxopropionate reductase [Tritonibacter horizontis]
MPGADLEIGVFGLGLIGTALSGRLLAAGNHLRGFDPDPQRCRDFAAAGGTVCTAQEVWAADVVFSCVFDTDQLAALIASAPRADCILVSVSTCDPDRMARLADQAAAKGIRLIEAPVSGTSRALADGTVLFLVAGDQAAATRVGPVLARLCRRQIHVGAIGNGNRAKLAINLVLGLNRAALAEGLVFAQALGLGAQDFMDMVRASAAHSDVMEAKGDLMIARNFAPQGRMAQSFKDFSLIENRAAELGQGLPFTDTYLAMMRDALEQGEGDLDNSAILLPIERSRPRQT